MHHEWEAGFTFAIVAVGIVPLLWDVFTPDFIFLGLLAALMAVGILPLEEALSA